MSPPASPVAGADILPAAAQTSSRCSGESPAVVSVGAIPLASTEAAPLCLGGAYAGGCVGSPHRRHNPNGTEESDVRGPARE